MAKTYAVTRLTPIINLPFAWLGRLGLGADYRYLLTVRGRRSGREYSTPVDAIEHDGRRWLVAPYGVTEWVRNVRSAGEVELSRGRTTTRMRAREVGADEAAPVLRRYLALVPVTRPYVDIDPDAPLETFHRVAVAHPVFELTPRGSPP
jgi:deazaflavin-dependent oxidoreductase (nitroreductase family)